MCILMISYGPICKFFRFIEHERIMREIRIELLHTLTQISNLESARNERNKNSCRFDTILHSPSKCHTAISIPYITQLYTPNKHVTSYMGKHFHMFFISPTALLPSIEQCVRARAQRTNGRLVEWMGHRIAE